MSSAWLDGAAGAGEELDLSIKCLEVIRRYKLVHNSHTAAWLDGAAGAGEELDLSPCERSDPDFNGAEDSIKALLERKPPTAWDAAIKKYYDPFYFVDDGVPMVAVTNIVFAAGHLPGDPDFIGAEDSIKAVLERKPPTAWDAATSDYGSFYFVVDGVPMVAATNIVFAAGHPLGGLYPASINDIGIYVHMVDDAQGIIANQRMIVIIDSASPVHCTGNGPLFTNDYTRLERGSYVYGVGGGRTEVLGSGTIRDERFHMMDVKYIPGLNQADAYKTIFSVSKLAEDGYSVNFDDAGGCIVMDKRSQVWNWKKLTWSHEIVGEGCMINGHYHMDYLRMRAPVSTSEGTGVVKALLNAASSGWSIITGLLLSQGATDQSLPV